MKLERINVPRFESEFPLIFNGQQSRIFSHYLKIVEETESGKQVLAALESDPRVKSLEGQMICKGSSATLFNPKYLAMWLLWAVHEFGQEAAENGLDEFLNSDEIPVINALWVLGVSVDESIQLADGFCLTPISAMPDSVEKDLYSRIYLGGSGPDQPRPRAAITFRSKVSKCFPSGESASAVQARNESFWESAKQLHDVALALNVIEDTSCTPYFSSAYGLPNMPMGLFGGSGGGGPLHDVIGFATHKVLASQIGEVNEVFKSLSRKSEKEKVRYRRVLSRLSQSKRRVQIEEKILDLGIALEMILLDDNKNLQQLSLTFRLRGSWLIASDKLERQSIYRHLRDLYDYRSQVAHGGVLCGNDPDKLNLVRESIQGYTVIAERIVKRLICGERPDWSDLLLGAV